MNDFILVKVFDSQKVPRSVVVRKSHIISISELPFENVMYLKRVGEKGGLVRYQIQNTVESLYGNLLQ